MPNHVLFVCKSCNSVHSDKVDYEKAEGAVLLKQCYLHHDGFHEDELDIRPVGCFGTCSSPCAVAFSATDKPTYLFTQVPTTAASALIEFGNLYRNSKTGNIPWKHFPEALQSASLAKVPPPT